MCASALLGAVRSDAQPPVRQVLRLQAVNRGNPSIDHFTGEFRVELAKRAETPVNVVQIVLGPTSSVGASEQAVIDYIRSTFIDRPKPDLIMTLSGPRRSSRASIDSSSSRHSAPVRVSESDASR